MGRKRKNKLYHVSKTERLSDERKKGQNVRIIKRMKNKIIIEVKRIEAKEKGERITKDNGNHRVINSVL